MNRTTTLLSAIAGAGTIAAAGSAFTGSNSVAASSASSGTTAIRAYTTSNVRYGANTTDPQVLDSVTFTLSAAARYVAIRTTAAGTWHRSDDLRLTTATVDSCTSANDTTWTCNITEPVKPSWAPTTSASWPPLKVGSRNVSHGPQQGPHLC